MRTKARRAITVEVTPRNGETTISINEDETQMLASTMGLGSLAVGQFAFWIGNTDITVWVIVGPVAAVLIGGTQIWKLHRRKRHAFLSGVVDRLARHVTQTAVLPRPE